MISLNDLNAVKACETPFEFEYIIHWIDDSGKARKKRSGVYLQVLGDESEHVAVETAALVAAERARANTLGDKYETDNAKLGKQMAAIRLVGWKNIKEEFSREGAMTLCLTNTAIADQVIQQSKNLANFIKL